MNNGKSKIENTFDTYQVTIPSKKSWFTLLFGTIWLGGWLIGFIFTGSGFLNIGESGEWEFESYMLIWLFGWILSGVLVIGLLLWAYFGKEKLAFEGSMVRLEKTIFGLGIKLRLEKAEIRDFRFESINTSMYGGSRMAVWGVGPGKVKFDYGMKTYSLGLAVDDAEANYLVEELNQQIE